MPPLGLLKFNKRPGRLIDHLRYLEFNVDFVLNRPQNKFQLDEKPQRAFLVTPFEKVSRRARVAHSRDKMRGQAAFTNFHPHC